ncbi:MAG: cupin domain-containing protein [Alphaproteobacteria bacterium]|nr:cupin domain-containing protein [Alphaproteobacteria bacterium]
MAKTTKKTAKARAAKTAKKAASRRKGPPHLLRAVDMAKLEQTFSHPWNPRSEITGVMMGRALGLKRLGVNFARIPAGKESFVPHAHQREEEWLYILYGQGMALIGDEEVEVGAGDFLAFPAPQVAHHLRNTGFEDLVYLMGGEALDADVVDFPSVKKRGVRVGEEMRAYDLDAGRNPFAPRAAKAAKKTPPAKKK